MTAIVWEILHIQLPSIPKIFAIITTSFIHLMYGCYHQGVPIITPPSGDYFFDPPIHVYVSMLDNAFAGTLLKRNKDSTKGFMIILGVFYYTADGSEPNQASAVFPIGGLDLPIGRTVLKVGFFVEGRGMSPIVEAEYLQRKQEKKKRVEKKTDTI